MQTLSKHSCLLAAQAKSRQRSPRISYRHCWREVQVSCNLFNYRQIAVVHHEEGTREIHKHGRGLMTMLKQHLMTGIHNGPCKQVRIVAGYVDRFLEAQLAFMLHPRQLVFLESCLKLCHVRYWDVFRMLDDVDVKLLCTQSNCDCPKHAQCTANKERYSQDPWTHHVHKR